MPKKQRERGRYMKKILSLFLCGLFLCSSFSLSASAEGLEEEEAAPDTGVTINVYNWGEYISDGSDGTLNVNQEFTRRTGIKVNYTTFDTNESLYSCLLYTSRHDLCIYGNGPQQRFTDCFCFCFRKRLQYSQDPWPRPVDAGACGRLCRRWDGCRLPQ